MIISEHLNAFVARREQVISILCWTLYQRNICCSMNVGRSFVFDQTQFRLKHRLNDRTFSPNIVFVTQSVEWLNGQTMFDQTSNK